VLVIESKHGDIFLLLSFFLVPCLSRGYTRFVTALVSISG